MLYLLPLSLLSLSGLSPALAGQETHFCIDQDTRVEPCSDNRDILFEDNPQVVAHVRFSNRINKTGWAELDLESNGRHDAYIQAYHSGFLEGKLTAHLIDSLRENIGMGKQGDRNDPMCKNYSAFIEDNLNWTVTKMHQDNDLYWRQVGLVLYQLAGIDDGYSAAKGLHAPRKPHLNLNPCGSIFLNLMAELYDLSRIMNNQHSPVKRAEHCSALVKWVPSLGEVFVSQNTWTLYDMMLRILKKYTLNYREAEVKSVSMSSYPGLIFSVDDFYITSAQLVVQETSIACFNDSLYKGLNARNIIFEFIRNTVANRLSQTGYEWAYWFLHHNSGTYNNQFMIVDFKKLVNWGTVLEDAFLVVFEQMGTLTHYKDMTEHVRTTTYWPSYNVPYFADIYQQSGYAAQYAKYGDYYSYEKTARAQIFRRDHHKVHNVSSMYHLMRYNDFQHDPLSRCENCSPQPNAFYAIASRGDLNDPNGKYPLPELSQILMGAIDAKITSSKLANNLEMIAISGPTAQQETVFDWRKAPHGRADKHVDQPDVWNFKPVHTKWNQNDNFDEFQFNL